MMKFQVEMRNYSKYYSNRWFLSVEIYISLKFLEKSKENYKKYWIEFPTRLFSLLLLIEIVITHSTLYAKKIRQ